MAATNRLPKFDTPIEDIPLTVDEIDGSISMKADGVDYELSENEMPEIIIPTDFFGIGSEYDLQQERLRKQKQLQSDDDTLKQIEQNQQILTDKHNNYIKRSDQENYLYWQEVMRKGKFTKKDLKVDRIADAAREGGFKLKESLVPFSHSLKAVDANGIQAVTYSSKKAVINDKYIFDESAIKVACEAVKKGGLKKPCIFCPSQLDGRGMSHEQKIKYYSMVFEGLMAAGYDQSAIKFDNSKYEAEIRNKYAGLHNQIGIGEFDPNLVSDKLAEGNGIKEKPVKTQAQKEITTDAYELFKAVDKATNRLSLHTKYFLFDNDTKKRNAINDINQIANGKDLSSDKVKFLRSLEVDESLSSAFKELKTEMLAFKEKYEGKPEFENYKDVIKTIELLDQTGFNPNGANRYNLRDNLSAIKNGEGFLNILTNKYNWKSEKKLKLLQDVNGSLNGLKNQIQEQNNYEFATLDKNSTKEIDLKRSLITSFQKELEAGNVENASNRSTFMLGKQLNNISNTKLGSKIFPDTAIIHKFNLAGEGVDLYFFQGKHGMEVAAGSGNKISKPRRTNIDLNTLTMLMKACHDKPVANAAQAPESVSPASPEQIPTPVDNKPQNAPEAAKTAPVVEVFNVHNKNRSFDMTFTDGVATHNGIAYLLKKQVGDVDSEVKALLEKSPDLLAVKVLDVPPMDAYNLLEAESVYETRNKPELVNNFYVIPGVSGYLAYELGDNNMSVDEMKQAIEGAAKAAGVEPKEVIGVFKTELHTFNLAEIKMSDKESTNPDGYEALKELKFELQSATVVAFNDKIDLEQEVKNAKPKNDDADFVDDDPTDNVVGIKNGRTDLSAFDDDQGFEEDFDNAVDELLDDEADYKRKNKFKPK